MQKKKKKVLLLNDLQSKLECEHQQSAVELPVVNIQNNGAENQTTHWTNQLSRSLKTERGEQGRRSWCPGDRRTNEKRDMKLAPTMLYQRQRCPDSRHSHTSRRECFWKLRVCVCVCVCVCVRGIQGQTRTSRGRVDHFLCVENFENDSLMKLINQVYWSRVMFWVRSMSNQTGPKQFAIKLIKYKTVNTHDWRIYTASSRVGDTY